MAHDVWIQWLAARSANRENWDDRVALHEVAYGLDAFDDPDHLSDVVRHDLAALGSYLPNASVAGLDVCHLQCHIGTDTVSLARAGARVTGVDFSAPALASARRLAERAGVQVSLVEADVLDARAAVAGEFDLVYTSIGAITWLADLDRWAQQVARLLRAGGLFYIRDGHPSLYNLDETSPDLRVRYRYFPNGQAMEWNEPGTYVGDGVVAHSRTYEWPHPISEIINAVLGAGLELLRFDEGRTLPWRFSERMTPVPGGYEWPEGERDNVPCTYTLIARR